MTRALLAACALLMWGMAAVAQTPPAPETSRTRTDAALVIRHGLLPWTKGPGTPPEKVFHLPYLKVYEGGRLLWSGPPQALPAPVSLAAWRAQPPTGKGLGSIQLEQELKALSLSWPAETRQRAVVVIYESEPCPPCDALNAPALLRLDQGFGANVRPARLHVSFR